MKTLNDILAHHKAYRERLYLVASENSPSMNARLAFLTDALNRYCFPLEEYRHWAFPGNEFIETVYERCRGLLRGLTGAELVSIRPISGVSAMTVALAALARAGDTIATIFPENGGHTITAPLAERLGLRVAYLPYDASGFFMDIEALPDFVEREGVKLIYLDQANVLFPHPIAKMRSVIPPSVKIYYDGSHVMGLVFGKNFQDPLGEGAHFLGGSTHKTIPGPHKAFIATNDPAAFSRISSCAKIFISHDHGGDIAALTIVLEEMNGRWGSYAAQVVKNAQHFAAALLKHGFNVLAKDLGFTRSHQVWLDVESYEEPFEAVKTLARHNIIVNTIANAPALGGRLAVRAGVQEVTYCGADEAAMDEIADIFAEILIRKRQPENEIKRRVLEIKKGLLPPFDEALLEKALQTLFRE